MNKIFRFKLILYIYLFFLNIKTCYGKVVTIRNNDENFRNFKNIINDIQNDKNGLTIKFEDMEYDMTEIGYSIDITVNSDINFIGNSKGTLFDYKNKKKGTFNFNISQNSTITFENIIFDNAGSGLDSVSIIYISFNSKNNNVIFNNCTFQNNYLTILNIQSDYVTKNINIVLFNHCKFFNNDHNVVAYNGEQNSNNNQNIYLLITMKKCNFYNNRDMFTIQNSQLNLENCYIKNVEKGSDKNFKSTFFYSKRGFKSIHIKESLFENIEIKSTFPLINGGGLTLEIENTTFSNCHSEFGYLFILKKTMSDNYVIIKNSTFIDTSTLFIGDSYNYTILDSTFKNINNKNSIPVIANSKYSNFHIENINIQNINTTNSLFNGESWYNFNNVKMKNIKANAKALLHFIYKDTYINNLEADNISCVGDSEDTSIILFDSNELGNSLTINNLNIKNSSSNGSFIKIIGNTSEVTIKNSNLNGLISYGSLIDNLSIKSNNIISNLNFNNNSNNNKIECGNIHFCNDINITLSNSTFSKNIIKNNGGAICIDNIKNLGLKFISNTFDGNIAENGGALYIVDGQDMDLNENRDIYFENNIFCKNIAHSFGGAIYSNFTKLYLANVNNNIITYNKAEIMGGGIFSPNSVNKTSFNINKVTIENNTVDSLDNNYSSNPYYINLDTPLNNNIINIMSGDRFPLSFTLYDEFHNIIKDNTKYYSSSLILKIILMTKNNDEYEYDDCDECDDNQKIHLINNIGSFTNGKCELNYLKIIANQDEYIMKFIIDNYNDKINFNINDIKVKVNKCSDDKIEMHDANGIIYCETPKCSENCPINHSAVCKPNLINNIIKNTCECLPGWKDDCKTKIYLDYSKINKGIVISVIVIIVIIVMYMIFIMFNVKQGIIKDIGYIKILLFSVGVMLYFSSNLLLTYTTYVECSLNILLKHIGISLIILIYYLINTLNRELGFSQKANVKFFDSDSEVNEGNYNNSNNNGITVLSNSNSNNLNTIMKSTMAEVSSNQIIKIYDMEIIENMKKQIRRINSLYAEALLIFLIYISSIIVMIFVRKSKYMENKINDYNIIQSNKGEWFYKCELETFDLILNILEFLVFALLLSKGKKLLNYEGIFICTKYITLSIAIVIIFGPIINIFSFNIFINQRWSRVIFDLIFNSLCYFCMFICFSWDKIYYVIRKKGNDVKNYFLFKKHDLCNIHNSYTCGCKLNIPKEEQIQQIQQSIDIYKACSTLYIISHKKFRRFGTLSKLDCRMEKIGGTVKKIDTEKLKS